HLIKNTWGGELPPAPGPGCPLRTNRSHPLGFYLDHKVSGLILGESLDLEIGSLIVNLAVDARALGHRQRPARLLTHQTGDELVSAIEIVHGRGLSNMIVCELPLDCIVTVGERPI